MRANIARRLQQPEENLCCILCTQGPIQHRESCKHVCTAVAYDES